MFNVINWFSFFVCFLFVCNLCRCPCRGEQGGCCCCCCKQNSPGAIHYSLEFARQVHLLSSPLQLGPIYFLVPPKHGIIGICCKTIPHQISSHVVDVCDWHTLDISGHCQKTSNNITSNFLLKTQGLFSTMTNWMKRTRNSAWHTMFKLPDRDWQACRMLSCPLELHLCDRSTWVSTSNLLSGLRCRMFCASNEFSVSYLWSDCETCI